MPDPLSNENGRHELYLARQAWLREVMRANDVPALLVVDPIQVEISRKLPWQIVLKLTTVIKLAPLAFRETKSSPRYWRQWGEISFNQVATFCQHECVVSSLNVVTG